MKTNLNGAWKYVLLAYGWLMGMQWLVVAELDRLYLLFSEGRPYAWAAMATINTLLLAIWLFLPFAFQYRRKFILPKLRTRHTVCLTLMTVVLSCIRTESTEVPDLDISFLKAGPVVHDEFSYLAQADLFLKGKWYASSPEITPKIFHQMHMMSEGKFASRYLPGTAAWIAPFRYFRLEAFSGWVAFAVSASLGAIVVARSSGPWAGLSTGVLIATSPGMCVFSSLLLAHLPCLVGLALFLWGVQRLMNGGGGLFAGATGLGLAFSMLCRPLTAAAVGFPFGCWMLCAGLRGICAGGRSRTDWSKRWAGTAIPLAFAFGVIAWQNQSVCNSILKMPYAEYTQAHTPRHVFGFDNGQRGDLLRGEKTLVAYDDWARNLDRDMARDNVEKRFRACVDWTIGWPTFGVGFLLIVLVAYSFTQFSSLVLLSCFLLHLVHVPYWLAGILDYHYVFESGFLWLLVLGSALGAAVDWSNRTNRPAIAISALLLVTMVGLCNQTGVYGNLTPTKTQLAVEKLSRTAVRYDRFEQACASADIQIPAIILVQPTPDDLHVEYVRNSPPFDSDILVGVVRAHSPSAEDIKRLHSNRTIYRFDSLTAILTKM